MSKKQYKTWRDPRIARKFLSSLTTITIKMEVPLKYKGVAIDGLKPDPFATLSRKFVNELEYTDKSLGIKIVPLGNTDTKEYFWSGNEGLFSYQYLLKQLPFFLPKVRENMTGVKRQFRFDGVSFVELQATTFRDISK